jgi:hypothetical protein
MKMMGPCSKERKLSPEIQERQYKRINNTIEEILDKKERGSTCISPHRVHRYFETSDVKRESMDLKLLDTLLELQLGHRVTLYA